MDVERILAATQDKITPVAVVDEEIVERNLGRMAKLAADHNVKLRPHAKTHKSAYMALRQMAYGAVGLTCATFTEAEVFADAGVDDVSSPIRRSVGPSSKAGGARLPSEAAGRLTR